MKSKCHQGTWRILVFLSLACYYPSMTGALSQKSGTQTVDIDETASPFMEVTITARPPENINIISMETGDTQGVARIVLMILVHLQTADIFVIDERMKETVTENEVSLELSGSSSAAQVSLVFEVDGSRSRRVETVPGEYLLMRRRPAISARPVNRSTASKD